MVARFYHSTTREAADAILRDGFKDTAGGYLADHEFTGVWISDVPLDGNEGAKGDVLLGVDIDLDAVMDYESAEEGHAYREFLVPAELLNRRGTVSEVDEPNA